MLGRQGQGRHPVNRTGAVALLICSILCTAPTALQALKGDSGTSSFDKLLPQLRPQSQADLDVWQDVPEGRFPYLASLSSGEDHSRSCVGIIVRGGYVLTSTFCTKLVGLNPLVIVDTNLHRSDSVEPQVMRVSNVHTQSKYIGSEEQSIRSAQKDIELLKLSVPLNISAPRLANVPPGSNDLVIVCNASLKWGKRTLAVASDVSFGSCSKWTSTMTCDNTCPCDSGGLLLLPSKRDGKLSAGDPQEDVLHGIISNGVDWSKHGDGRPSREYVRVDCVRDLIEDVPSVPEKVKPPRQQAITVVKSIIHHKWDGQQRSSHNAALLKLQQAVNLPTPQLLSDLVILRPPQRLSALGYGGITPPELGAAIFSWLKMEEHSFLDAETSNREAMWNGGLPEGMLSSINSQQMASCMVDSGSPLMLMDAPGDEFDQGKPELDFFAGINVDGAPCGTPGKPDIYIDVRQIRDWAIEQMQEPRGDVPYIAGPVPIGRFPYLAHVAWGASEKIVTSSPKIGSAGKDGLELRCVSCMGVLVRPDAVLTVACCAPQSEHAEVVIGRDMTIAIKHIQRVHQNAPGCDAALVVLADEVPHRHPVVSTQPFSCYGRSKLFGFKSNGDMVPVAITTDGTVSDVELAPGSPILELDPNGPYNGCPMNDVLVGIASRQSAANGKNKKNGAREPNVTHVTLCAHSVIQNWIDGAIKSEVRSRRGHDIAMATGMVALGFAVTTNRLPVRYQQVFAFSVVAGLVVALGMEGITMLKHDERIAIGISLVAILLKVFMNSSERLRHWGFDSRSANSKGAQKAPADPKAKGVTEQSCKETGGLSGSAVQNNGYSSSAHRGGGGGGWWLCIGASVGHWRRRTQVQSTEVTGQMCGEKQESRDRGVENSAMVHNGAATSGSDN
eukprot:evm.model.scf_2428.1 EVM.evm.TU.scf_2428.1   scf_2428:2370-16843(-)